LQCSEIYELFKVDLNYNIKQEIANNIERGLTIIHIRKIEDFDKVKINQDLCNPFLE
jgi:hypothetical protein